MTARVRLPRLTRPVDPSPQTWESERVANVVRALVIILCGALAALASNRHETLPWFPLLIAAATIGSVRQQTTLAGRIGRIVEALMCAAAILGTQDSTSPLFPYLIAPAFAGGLLAGVTGAFTSPGFAALVLLAGMPFVDESNHDWGVSIVEWVLLAVAAGLLAAWIRRLLAPGEPRPQISDSSYAAAYRLLSQLRPVARQLSVGLDPGTIAQSLLQSLKDVHDFERGAVYVRTGAGRLVPLAFIGSSRIDWEVDVTGDGPFAEAWLSQ